MLGLMVHFCPVSSGQAQVSEGFPNSSYSFRSVTGDTVFPAHPGAIVGVSCSHWSEGPFVFGVANTRSRISIA